MSDLFKRLTNLQKISLTLASILTGGLLYKPTIEKLSNILYKHNKNYLKKKYPNRIIIIRHGESEGNVNNKSYSRIPDNKIKLTERGIIQSKKAGKKLRRIVKDEYVRFYVSPYTRAINTFENIIKSFDKDKISFKIDYGIREQEFGNLNDVKKEVYEQRLLVGRFYYRFLTGENGADCRERVNSFIQRMFKEATNSKRKYENVVLICHGIIMRIIIMALLDMPIDVYQKLDLPRNCKFWILNKQKNGKYMLESRIKYMI